MSRSAHPFTMKMGWSKTLGTDPGLLRKPPGQSRVLADPSGSCVARLGSVPVSEFPERRWGSRDACNRRPPCSTASTGTGIGEVFSSHPEKRFGDSPQVAFALS